MVIVRRSIRISMGLVFVPDEIQIETHSANQQNRGYYQ